MPQEHLKPSAPAEVAKSLASEDRNGYIGAMAKIYSLVVFIRGRKQAFHFIVDKSDYDRLSNILNAADGLRSPSFFWCDTNDDRSVIINLKAVQAVRFLWDGPFESRNQETRDEPIAIYLRGRDEPIDADTDSAESIHNFFSQLELDPKIFPFPNFIDSDGEYVYVNASEVDLVIAPKELMDEGIRLAQDDLDERTHPKLNLVRKNSPFSS